MSQTNQTDTLAHPPLTLLHTLTPLLATLIGVPVAIAVAAVYGLPLHAVVVTFVMILIGSMFGVTLGFHRHFTHRSFCTFRPVEWLLMICGCVGGQAPPFSWVATHRKHHQHSDKNDDPHSPNYARSPRLGLLGSFWHVHFGWWMTSARGYDATLVRDLTRRSDLVWIDRHWYVWYLLGLTAPAAIGWLIGGTAYDALIGFLWGGLLRLSLSQQGGNAINSFGHLFGPQPFDTGDNSRNNRVLGPLTFGEGWHNNHHAFPYSARHGFLWWQADSTWCLIWLMERFGLAWRVRRPPTTLVLPRHKGIVETGVPAVCVVSPIAESNDSA